MWTLADIPRQSGRRAVVTGTGGLGYETALALAAAGADVVLAGRSETKGRGSVVRILNQHSQAHITFERLDLDSLASLAYLSGPTQGHRPPTTLFPAHPAR